MSVLWVFRGDGNVVPARILGSGLLRGPSAPPPTVSAWAGWLRTRLKQVVSLVLRGSGHEASQFGGCIQSEARTQLCQVPGVGAPLGSPFTVSKAELRDASSASLGLPGCWATPEAHLFPANCSPHPESVLPHVALYWIPISLLWDILFSSSTEDLSLSGSISL